MVPARYEPLFWRPLVREIRELYEAPWVHPVFVGTGNPMVANAPFHFNAGHFYTHLNTIKLPVDASDQI